MVILLGLAAAALYGTGDFLGGLATRRLHVLAVLLLAETAGTIVAVPAAAVMAGPVRLTGLVWGFGAGLIGGLGLILFYKALAAGPMSVVAPVSALVATVLPVAVAVAGGERPTAGIAVGALLCLAAIVMASSGGDPARGTPGTGRAVGAGIVAGLLFGLYFLLIRNAGQTGELWPVAAGRIGELAAVLVAVAVLRPSIRVTGTSGLLGGGVSGGMLLAAGSAGAIDVIATICYVAATRAGAFGLAVVLASLYPGVTVLLARTALGERLRWVQRAGLGLAAIGVILVAA